MKLVPKDEPKDTFTLWLWIIAIVLTIATLFAAVIARAQEPGFFACPPGVGNQCEARVKAPDSPQVDRVCLRRFGSTAIHDELCVAVTPGAEVRIPFSNPAAGQGHVRYEVVACDVELNLCSQPAPVLAIAVDLDVPTFFEVLRRALGL